MTISPSIYSTFGDITKETKSYSVASYLTINYQEHYALVSYSYYLEDWKTSNLRQHNFSLGYAKAFSPTFRIRTIGFFINNSYHNLSGIISGRVFYGYNPIYSIGIATSSYSLSLNNQKNFYNTVQINPDIYYYAFGKIWMNFGINYTNATGENYLALLSGFSINVLPRLTLKISSGYGKLFYHIDDRLLIVNNRLNVQTASISVYPKYYLTNNLKIALVLQKDFYRTYEVNYYALGIEFN